MTAPFGVLAVTLLLLARSGQWGGWESLEPAASLVDLAVVVYGMIAVLVERGVNMVFWALEERKKRIASRKAEGQAELIAEMLADAKAEGDEEYAKRLEREAIDRGIPLDKLPRK